MSSEPSWIPDGEGNALRRLARASVRQEMSALEGTHQATYKSFEGLHWTIVIIVFSIAGSVSLLLTRFVPNSVVQIEGELWSGPWSYRVAYLLVGPPVYTMTLVMVGTLFGKHAYFKRRALRVWGLLLPKRMNLASFGAVFKAHPFRRR